MKSAETSDTDAFFNDLADHEQARVGLSGVVAGLAAQPVDSVLRSHILDSLDPYQRFVRFEAAVAELLHCSLGDAAAALRRIDDARAWQEQAPGLAYLSVPSGPSGGFFLSGFLRVDAGLEFPQHEHLGEEITFVLQGAFEESNSGRVFGPGQPSYMPGGSRHTFRVLPDGPNLLGLVTVKGGVRLVSDSRIARSNP